MAILANLRWRLTKERRIDDEIQLGSVTDEQGHTVGLEDPHNPALIDDPAIFGSNLSTVEAANIAAHNASSNEGDPSAPQKNLIDSRGEPFVDPKLYGGSLMGSFDPSTSLGEPLNVIISAQSSPAVLTRKGLQNYLRSLDLDMECLDLHSGSAQKAFLDPRGYVDQNFLYREVYTPLDHVFGTCIESLRGGNHIRAWQQMGTGAWFFASSKEENVTKHHMIVPNGYDIGRDWVVQQSQKKAKGITTFLFKTYQTRVEYVTGLLPAGAQSINHDIAIDGKVALLTIKLLSSDDKALLRAKKRANKDVAQTATAAQPKRFSFNKLATKRQEAVRVS